MLSACVGGVCGGALYVYVHDCICVLRHGCVCVCMCVCVCVCVCVSIDCHRYILLFVDIGNVS